MLSYYKKGGFGKSGLHSFTDGLTQYEAVKTDWFSGGINITREIDIRDTLPIIFIPSFTKKKLEALGHDYKRVFKDLGYYRISGVNYGWDTTIDYKKSIRDFNSLVGIDESILISVLNNRMGRGLNGYVNDTSPVQDYITFNLSEVDYLATLANKLIPALSQSSDNIGSDNPFTIEKDNECIYIIMNTNSFYDFDNTYKVLSRELCEMLLGLVDDSFVFQSAYFKCL